MMQTPKIRNVLVDSEGNIFEKVRSSPLPLDVPQKKLSVPGAPSTPKLKVYKPEDLLKEINTPKTRARRADQGPNGHWDFPEQLGYPYFGFIYLIKNFINGKMYIGKKQYLGSGKVNRGQETTGNGIPAHVRSYARISNNTAKKISVSLLWSNTVSVAP